MTSGPREPLRVLVTGVGGGGYGEQIFKALRLADTNYEIIGTDRQAGSYGLEFVDRPYVVPTATDPGYLDAILEICADEEVKVLFHGSEPELKVFSKNRDRITDAGLMLPAADAATIDLCMDKLASSRWLEDNGFPCPRTVNVQSNDDLESVDFFPCLLKPSIGGGGSAHVHLAQNQRDLQLLGEVLLANIGSFIVQEYMGTIESEFTVGVLHDLDGEFINSIAINRVIGSGMGNRIRLPNRTGRDELGAILAVSSGISQGNVGRFPEVTGLCEQIAGRLGTRGAINLQCRLVNGTPYVFEINPRFSGTTSLRALVGYNEPDVLIRRHIFGETIEPRFVYHEKRVMRGLSEVVISTE